MIGRMAAAASHASVRALENVAGQSMIEIVMRRFPFHDVERRTQVVCVARGALLIAGRVLHDPAVKTLVSRQPLSDLRMAPSALEFSRTQTKTMARRTVRSTFQHGMCLR
jgi:hypothetical protein